MRTSRRSGEALASSPQARTTPIERYIHTRPTTSPFAVMDVAERNDCNAAHHDWRVDVCTPEDELFQVHPEVLPRFSGPDSSLPRASPGISCVPHACTDAGNCLLSSAPIRQPTLLACEPYEPYEVNEDAGEA
ncbi:MAG: hypothetical protein H5T86_04175 [Armatimonadetes bacterium]|nr:hypothetical protein [Armatimonadota bacterium]